MVIIYLSQFFTQGMQIPELKDPTRPYEGYKTYRDYSSHFFTGSQWTKNMILFFDEMGKFNKARYSLLNSKQRALLFDAWFDHSIITGFNSLHGLDFNKFFAAFFAEYTKRENSGENEALNISVYNIGNNSGLPEKMAGNVGGLPPKIAINNHFRFK